MAAAPYNTLIDQAATYYLDITYEDPDGANPDLSSGYTAEMVFSQSWEGTSILTVDESDYIALAAGGSLIVSIPPATTGSLPAGNLFYHLEITKTSSGFVDRILRGRATVRPKAA